MSAVTSSALLTQPAQLCKVLLVEAREADAHLLQHALAHFRGGDFEVTVLDRLADALTYLETCEPDIVVADLSLPDCAGLETFERLHAARPSTPIVIMTSQSDHLLSTRVVDAGAQDHIVKGEVESTALGRMLLQAVARQRLRQGLSDHLKEVEISRTRLRNIVDLNLDAILLLNQRGEVCFANRRAEELFGQTQADLLSMTLGRPILDADNGASVTLMRPDGGCCRVRLRMQPMGWSAENAFMIMLSEINTSLNTSESGQALGADPVTGLFNRHSFHQQASLLLEHSREHDVTPAVLCLNLDNFRRMNEAMGHQRSDDLLRFVGERIRTQLRDGDIIGRFGGDEFVVLLTPLRQPGDAALVSEKILDALQTPIHLWDADVQVSGRIGISLYPRDGDNVGNLIQHAQAASRRAKEAIGKSIEFYTHELGSLSNRRFHLEQELRKALPNQQLSVVYQPIFAARSGQMLGTEALLRWQPAEGKSIKPDEFIPILEETGLINEVGEWVLHNACAQTQAWRQTGLDIQLSVNLSPLQFKGHSLLPCIERVLAATGLPARALTLELTESMLMHNAETSVGVLNALREVGISVAIDDFGTGFSSLNYLRRFAIDALKIDRSFIRDVTGNANDAAITRATIDLAHNLGLRVIGEGVETEDQREFLDRHGCDAYQGYYFSKPVDPKRIPALVRSNNKLARRTNGRFPPFQTGW